MTAVISSTVDLAVPAEALAMAMPTYDVCRLAQYARRAVWDEADRPAAWVADGLIALRFSEVDYFHRIAGARATIARHLDGLAKFYASRKAAVRLSVYPEPLAREEVAALGLDPVAPAGVEITWARPLVPGPCPPADAVGGWSFPAAQPMDATAFFALYLDLFAGPNCDRERAIANMRTLFEVEGLHLCWALYRGERVGLGLWHKQGAIACFCAGGMRPEVSGLGGHRALLAHRLERAAQGGCRAVAAVATEGGASGENLKRMGFAPIWRDAAWSVRFR